VGQTRKQMPATRMSSEINQRNLALAGAAEGVPGTLAGAEDGVSVGAVSDMRGFR
jgi:hypothetical protein